MEPKNYGQSRPRCNHPRLSVLGFTDRLVGTGADSGAIGSLALVCGMMDLFLERISHECTKMPGRK